MLEGSADGTGVAERGVLFVREELCNKRGNVLHGVTERVFEATIRIVLRGGGEDGGGGDGHDLAGENLAGE